jgi:hypothetical protein
MDLIQLIPRFEIVYSDLYWCVIQLLSQCDVSKGAIAQRTSAQVALTLDMQSVTNSGLMTDAGALLVYDYQWQYTGLRAAAKLVVASGDVSARTRATSSSIVSLTFVVIDVDVAVCGDGNDDGARRLQRDRAAGRRRARRRAAQRRHHAHRQSRPMSVFFCFRFC